MNKYQLASVMGDIDEHFVSKTTKRAANKKPLLRSIAAAAAAVLLVSGAMLGISRFVGIGEAPKLPAQQEAASPNNNAFLTDTIVPEDAVLPPVRVGSFQSPSDPVVFLNFEQFYDDTAAVCILTIGDWLGDNGTGTYYEATVEKVYKGDLPEKIKLYQVGNEKWTLEYYPLFTYGDRLLIALETWPDLPDYEDGFDLENCYQPAAAFISYFFISSDENGVEYLLEPCSLFSYTNQITCDLRFNNYGNDRVLVRQLCEKIAEYDPVVADLILNREKYTDRDSPLRDTYVYSFEEFDAYLSSR